MYCFHSCALIWFTCFVDTRSVRDGLTPLFARAPTAQHTYSLRKIQPSNNNGGSKANNHTDKTPFYSHVCVVNESTVLLVQSRLAAGSTHNILRSTNAVVCLRFSFPPPSTDPAHLAEAVCVRVCMHVRACVYARVCTWLFVGT
jgi:hypothetical protein